MPQPQIIDWRKINDSNIIFGDPKKNSHHGLTVPIKYQAEKGAPLQPIILQSPVMRAPFGVTDETGEYGRKVEISLSFPGYAPNINTDARGSVSVEPAWPDDEAGNDMSAFYNLISGWDGRNERTALERGESWFGKKISDVVIQELMKRNIKPSSEPEKYSPTFRIKVPVTGPKGAQIPSDQFFGAGGEPIGFEEMARTARGSRVIVLFKATGLWFAGKSFGMNFQMLQVVRIENDKFNGCAISIPTHLRAVSDRAPVDDDDLATPPIKMQRLNEEGGMCSIRAAA